MADLASEKDRFNAWLPLCAAVTAIAVFIPFAIYGYNVGELLYLVVILPIIGLLLLTVAITIACFRRFRRSLTVLSMVAVYVLASWLLFRNSATIHFTGKWMLESGRYKAQVLALPPPANGELKHVEWDGWGFAGSDTSAYLVYDPQNLLSSALKNHTSGNFPGIPCSVPGVRRLGSHWYSIVFYTDTDWDHCGLANKK